MTGSLKTETENRKPGIGKILASRLKLLVSVLLISGFSLFISAPGAQATGCTSPAGNEGDYLYNNTSHVYQFCNGTNWMAMGPVPGNGPGFGGNRVFVTSTTQNGAIGSVAAANTICANRATAASLPGTYKAWIAVITGTNDPATTFTHSAIPYKEVDGTVIASNWAGLISGTLTNGISKDETGATQASVNVWTNVATDGTATTSGSSTLANCLGWTTSAAVDSGCYGTTSTTNLVWTAVNCAACSALNHLYCFQQDGGAGCSGPAGNEADMIYNSASHVYQYCDGTYWRAMGPVPGTAAAGPTSGLVGWWNFDEGSGTTAADSSGNGNTGYLGNSPTWTASGKINGALTFVAATPTYVLANYSSLFDFGTGSFTVSAWMKANSLPATQHSAEAQLVGKQIVNESKGWAFQLLDSSGTGYPDIWVSDGTNNQTFTNFTALSLGVWYHLVFIVDRSTNTLRSYVNGVKDAAEPSIAGYGNVDEPDPVMIGSERTTAQSAFDGTLDDVRIYNRVLSAAEVTALYNATADIACASPLGVEAIMIYNGTSHVLQYCDGSVWRQLQ